MAKRFMYVCLGILALAVAYHLGATTATSQSETAIAIGFSGADFPSVLTDQGNIYEWGPFSQQWFLICNFPAGGVAAAPSTLGEIKARFGE